MKSLELLSEIALLATNLNDIYFQVDSILNLLCIHTQMSGAYIYIDNPDDTPSYTHISWNSPNIDSKIRPLSYSDICSIKELLHTNIHIISDNFQNLPKNLYKTFQYRDITSIIIYPLHSNQEINGFIFFEESKTNQKWDQDKLFLLSSTSKIFSNIFSKHNIQKKLEEQNLNFENYYNTIEDMVIIGNSEGNIISVNSAVIKKLEYSIEELLQMKIIELHPVHKREEAVKILQAMFEKQLDYCPLEVQSKKGRIIPVETRVWMGKWNNKDCIFGLSKDLSREQEALQKFTKLFENNPALMAVSNVPDEKFLDVNKSFIEKLGYSKDEIIGETSTNLGLFVQSEKRQKLADELAKFGSIYNQEIQVKCKDNQILEGLFSGEIIESQGKKYFLTVMVDITHQKYLQNLSNKQKMRLLSIIEGARLGTWEWNIKTGEVTFNERWAKIIGYTLQELKPTTIDTWYKFVHPEDLKISRTTLEKHFQGLSEYYDLECRMKHKNGNWIWIHDRGKVIEWDENGNPLMMYGIHSDITQKKEMENIIKESSIRDPLTNIYNRRHIYERLEKEIEKFKRDKIPFSISILDIDFFKYINDTYGHLAGDYILKQFTTILSENIRVYDLLGRYGGEEFIIITFNSLKKDTAGRIEGILKKVRSSIFSYNGNNIKFTFSCGICDTIDPDIQHISIESLIDLSDRRLYMAKNKGRNQIVFY